MIVINMIMSRVEVSQLSLYSTVTILTRCLATAPTRPTTHPALNATFITQSEGFLT